MTLNDDFEKAWKDTLLDGRLQPPYKGEAWIKELCRAVTIRALQNKG